MPALIEEEHPACAGLITAYKKCSATTSLLRKVFTSECTALKYQLDRCFQQEKLARTHHNLARRQVGTTDHALPACKRTACHSRQENSALWFLSYSLVAFMRACASH